MDKILRWSHTYKVFPTRSVQVLPVAYQVLCILHLQDFNSKQLYNMSLAMSPGLHKESYKILQLWKSNELQWVGQKWEHQPLQVQDGHVQKLPPDPGLLSHTSPDMLPRLQLLAGGIDLARWHSPTASEPRWFGTGSIVASGLVALHGKSWKKVLHSQKEAQHLMSYTTCITPWAMNTTTRLPIALGRRCSPGNASETTKVSSTEWIYAACVQPEWIREQNFDSITCHGVMDKLSLIFHSILMHACRTIRTVGIDKHRAHQRILFLQVTRRVLQRVHASTT